MYSETLFNYVALKTFKFTATKLPTTLHLFYFEWAFSVCTFAPSHGKKHLCATKKASAIFINLNIFN